MILHACRNSRPGGKKIKADVFLETAVVFNLWKIKLNKLYKNTLSNDCFG